MSMFVCQVVIYKATMMSSLMTRAVYEMATMCRNSDSNRRAERSMMAPPVQSA